MKIYLSGPVSDKDERHTQILFETAEEKIKQFGHEPISPLNIPDPYTRGDRRGGSWLYYMRESIILAMECDAIYCLLGWQDSKGSQTERTLFQMLDLPVYYYNTIHTLDKAEEKEMLYD